LWDGDLRVVRRTGKSMAKFRTSRIIQFVSILIATAAAPVAMAAEIAEAAWAELERESRVRVMVMLSEVAARGNDRAALAAAVDALLATLPAGARLERRFATVPALALSVDRQGLEALAAAGGVARVDLDEGGSGGLLQGLPLARIDPLQTLGFTGAGLKVAIIDSGIRLDHQSFAGRIVDEACFCTGCCPNGGNTQTGPGSGANGHPHGTNVAGIAVGGSGVAGVPTGAATGASIISIRVLDVNNSFCCSSDIVAAMDWLRVNHPDTKVANLSLGTGARFAGDCDQAAAFTQAMGAAVDGLVAQGTAVTVSSGNNGSSIDMQAPACGVRRQRRLAVIRIGMQRSNHCGRSDDMLFQSFDHHRPAGAGRADHGGRHRLDLCYLDLQRHLDGCTDDSGMHRPAATSPSTGDACADPSRPRGIANADRAPRHGAGLSARRLRRCTGATGYAATDFQQRIRVRAVFRQVRVL
jgi:subtilisin family serine protease